MQNHFIKRLEELESAMTALQEEKIRKEAQEAERAKIRKFVWDAVKSVLIPAVIAIATVMLSK